MNDLLTKDQLAEEIAVDPKTIERWVGDGVIDPAIREGKVIRFSRRSCLRRLSLRAKKSLRTPSREPKGDQIHVV